MKLAKLSISILCMSIVACAAHKQGAQEPVTVVGEPYIEAEIDRLIAAPNKQQALPGIMKDRLVLVIRRGMDLRGAIEDFAVTKGYKRVIFDIDRQVLEPGRVVNGTGAPVVIEVDQLADLGEAIQASLGANTPYEGLYFYEALDGRDAQALVMSTTDYGDRLLTIFEVQRGSLLDNATMLAREFGWNVPSEAWSPKLMYEVRVGYPLVAEDLIGGFSKLFRRYPVQAQLMPSTRNVVFVSRALPVNQ